MHLYIKPIALQFKEHADPVNAAGARAYMRNQFEHFGIPTPLRRLLYKEYMKKTLPAYKELPAIVKELWNLPQREYQYFAIELVAAMRKQWEPGIIRLAEYMITQKSWWDSVDQVASDITGPYFRLFPEQVILITGRWNESDNFWLQRSSIMFQKAYKKNTDTELLSKYILHCAGSEEFFIQKAIGWALREYSKTDPAWVKRFVKKYTLSPLSTREALKRII